jgi:hypothetical protein
VHKPDVSGNWVGSVDRDDKISKRQIKNQAMKWSLVVILAIHLWACSEKKKELQALQGISQSSLLKISTQWTSDSLGCLKLRDPQKIRLLIDQLKLIGQDSSLVIKHRGRPNGKKVNGDTTVFYYFMGCSTNGASSYNFYCDFKGKNLWATQTAVLN